MKFIPLKLSGAFLIEPIIHEDERGSFYRNLCTKEFGNNQLVSHFVQSNISTNKLSYTLRGLHFQRQPYAETKLIQCLKGKIWDVIVDLRKDSLTYCDWISIELCEDITQILYVPEGFAHGYITLTDDTQLLYLMSNFYQTDSVCGLHWNDEKINITWPHKPKILSDNDANLPNFENLINNNEL